MCDYCKRIGNPRGFENCFLLCGIWHRLCHRESKCYRRRNNKNNDQKETNEQQEENIKNKTTSTSENVSKKTEEKENNNSDNDSDDAISYIYSWKGCSSPSWADEMDFEDQIQQLVQKLAKLDENERKKVIERVQKEIE